MSKIDQRTIFMKIIFKVKSPRTTKKIPLKIIRQNFYKEFSMWYNDDKTGEAVIVLGSADNVYSSI